MLDQVNTLFEIRPDVDLDLMQARQPVEELATVATRLLLTGAAGVDPVLPTELVVRESA